MVMQRWFFALLLSIPLVASAGEVQLENRDGQQCVRRADVCFAPAVELDGVSVPLHAAYLFRYFGFKVYYIALYAKPEDVAAGRVLDATPKSLVIHYLRNFSRKDFQTSGRTVISENPTIDSSQIEQELAAIDSWYEEIVPGDRYRISFAPREGFQLRKNERLLGSQPGDLFQRAYFGIWLDREYSLDRSLTKSLLR